MARVASVPVRRPVSSVVATPTVAKALGLTRHGVRHLVQRGELRPSVEPTTGQWLFWREEVADVAKRRARLRMRARGEAWRALRLVARTTEPRQQLLPLGGEGRRKPTTHLRSERGGFTGAKAARLISPTMATRGDRRMAKAGLHDDRTARRTATGRR
jgi:hypothetical protein